MCGRYAFFAPLKELENDFGLEIDIDKKWPKEFKARYNIAPSQKIPTILSEDGIRKLKLFQWGFVPFWAKDPSKGIINAKSETVAEKPSFRNSFKKRRCVIPASGFYEWKKVDEKIKIPTWIYPQDEPYFLIAGIWDSWHPKENEMERIFTSAILTTEPNSLMKSIHDRMPVILSRDAADVWLDETIHDLEKLSKYFKPYSEQRMRAHPVSQLVNSPRNDQPECIQAPQTSQ